MDKDAARAQANFNLLSRQLRLRFAAALTREDQLRELWENTSEQLEVSKARNKTLQAQKRNLQKQLAIREEENTAVLKLHKKGKRKSFVKGMLVGITVGAVGTVLLLGQ